MPEKTDNYIHIPVKDKEQFEKKTFRTITISVSKGIKAVIGKLHGEDKTTVQKYLFAKTKGWTMAKAKKWVKEHKKKAVANIAKFDCVAEFTIPLEIIDTDEVSSLRDLEKLGIPIEEGGIYTKGIIHIDQINRNNWRADIKTMNTEDYMKTPITLYNHDMDVPTGTTVYLKKKKESIEAITHVTTTDEKIRADIETGTINAHSIRILPHVYERVCLENDVCFWDIQESELLEISHVTINANVGTNFEVLTATYEPIGEIVEPMGVKLSWNGDEISTFSTTGNIPMWGDNWTFTPVDIEISEQSSEEIEDSDNELEEKTKVENTMVETPNTPPTEVEGEDLSSTEERFSQFDAKFAKVEELEAKLIAKEAKVNEQRLGLLVKETMTLFEGVDNKEEIEKNITVIASGDNGEDALEATKAILKSVMESKVIVDSSLTPSGGEGLSAEDELSKADFGLTVPEMVAQIANIPTVHEIKAEG